MADYWFKPKTHGYGAYPTNWKGWVLILAFIVATSLLAISLIALPASRNSGPTLLHLAGWLVATLVAVIVFLRICRSKTDGEWKWRWGEKK